MKYIALTFFIGILVALGFALSFMLRGGTEERKFKSNSMAKALAFRIGISVLLFACLLFAWAMGWIQPTGIQVGT